MATICAASKLVVDSMMAWYPLAATGYQRQPSTLTDSIGIFSIINTYERTLNSSGMHTEGVATSLLADITATKVLPLAFSQRMQLSIEHEYKNFINLVIKARKIVQQQVD